MVGTAEILVVEHAEGDTLLFREAFREHGASVHTASDLAAAKRALRRVAPDAIVVAWRLDFPLAVQILRLAQRVCPDAAVVLLTLNAKHADTAGVRGLGASLVLERPETFAEFLGVARSVMQLVEDRRRPERD